MDDMAFERWLDGMGSAWQAKDAEAFCDLFADSARYFWTPFEAPKYGTDEIAEAFRSAVATQEDIHFEHSLVAWQDDTGLAHWHCRFNRDGKAVEIDGMLRALFDDEGLCDEFREWWHSTDH